VGWTVNPVLWLSRFESYHPHFFHYKVSFLLSESSSVGRAPVFQTGGREFESRLSLLIAVIFLLGMFPLS
jgi:hypothetical protein